jgi:hypothetical protein
MSGHSTAKIAAHTSNSRACDCIIWCLCEIGLVAMNNETTTERPIGNFTVSFQVLREEDTINGTNDYENRNQKIVGRS